MKCNLTAKNNFKTMSLTDFWAKYVHVYKSKYCNFITLLLFSSTYLSKSGFSIQLFYFYTATLTNAAGNPKEIFGIGKYLLGKDVKPSYPTTNNNENLAENFAQFFKSKIQKFYQQLFENTKSKCTDSDNCVSPTID